MLTNYYATSKGLKLDVDDFAMWLEAFFVAFKYRRWKDPKNKLYNDPKGPDKVIRRKYLFCSYEELSSNQT